MTDPAVRLRDVHPALRAAFLERILPGMAAFGAPLVIVEGVRSQARQTALYAQGRIKPGTIVTHVDGVTKRSQHQIQADGVGHAVDVAFAGPDGTVSWEGPWEVYGAMAEACGFRWGGRWKTIIDRPHVELP